jgi:hypothetical protein
VMELYNMGPDIPKKSKLNLGGIDYDWF